MAKDRDVWTLDDKEKVDAIVRARDGLRQVSDALDDWQDSTFCEKSQQ